MKTAIIIGAGPAGLSCAYKLAKQGIKVDIYESSSYIGGMSQSMELWGQRVDLGPHRFFSKDKGINLFFNELIKSDYTLVDRLTRIYYNNKFFNYPIKIFNVFKNLSLNVIIQILWDYFKIRIYPIKNPQTFEDWVTNRFGHKLYEIFFKHYSEKLWGIPCSKIDADWAAQRIKSLSLWAAVINAILGDKNNKHKTLVDQFAYPNNGTSTIYERAAEYVTNNGGHLYLSSPVKRLIKDESDKVIAVELEDGSIKVGDYFVSTMPLTTVILGLDNVPNNIREASDKLYYRNTILVYLEVDSMHLFRDNWLYIHSPEVKHGRITNFRNWSKELYRDKKTTILCMEFWAFDDDDIWKKSDEELSNIAALEIRKLDLFSVSTEILNTKVVKISKSYPVYETGYKKNLNLIERWLDQIPNLYPIGRYGAFKYNNQDHSILMGIAAAKKITEGLDIDLWKINTDDEYQENAKIESVL